MGPVAFGLFNGDLGKWVLKTMIMGLRKELL